MKEYYNQLNDLVEDLETDYNTYYHDIPREDFDNIVMLDPTYKQGSNTKGEFTKWLLTLYRRGERFEDDTIKGQIVAALDDYKDIKSQLKGDNAQYKDIMRFKTAKDFIDFMQNLDLTETTELELKCREVEGANVVTRNSDWVIYNPTTYEASKLIRGTNAIWCTGRPDSDYHFRSYTSGDGRLYIFIDSHDPDNKYQMSVRGTSVKELRNKNNTSVSVDSLVIQFPTLADLWFKTEPFKDLYEIRAAKKFATPEFRQAMKNIYDASTGVATITKENAETIKRGYNYEGSDFDRSLYEALNNSNAYNLISTINVIGVDPWGEHSSLCSAIKSALFRSEYSLRKCPRLLRLDLSKSSMVEVPNNLCENLVNLRYCTLPSSITHIASEAFKGCKDLRKLVLSKKIAEFGVHAFEGCDKLLLLVPHHKIQCKKIDLEWFKVHLKWSDREVTELKPKINDILEESFNKNMPEWLLTYFKNNAKNMDHLFKVIDFSNAEVISLDDEAADGALKVRDSRLTEPNLPIYLFTTNRGDEQLYIPNYFGQYTSCPWRGYWEKSMELGQSSKQNLIANATHIAYIPDHTRFLLAGKTKDRADMKAQLPTNYNRNRKAFSQQEVETEIPAHYNSKDKWVNATKLREIKWVTEPGYDKSGYRVTDKVDTIVNALANNRIDINSNILKSQINRLDGLKERLGKKLISCSTDDLLKPENEVLFEVIQQLKDVYAAVKSKLNNLDRYLKSLQVAKGPSWIASYKNTISNIVKDLIGLSGGYDSVKSLVSNIEEILDSRSTVTLK